MANIESLEYSRHFLKKLSRLPRRIVEEAQKKERLFVVEPFHSSLRTHKLHGKDQDMWAFWIDYRYRIKFTFTGGHSFVFGYWFPRYL